MRIKVKLEKGAYMPRKAHEDDAGYDLYSPIGAVIPAQGSVFIDTGVHVAIPHDYCGMIKSKSGLNVKHDITSEGVIDCGYTGSIGVKLYNHGKNDYVIEYGDKISQLVIMPIAKADTKLVLVDIFEDTARGICGFGSTGR